MSSAIGRVTSILALPYGYTVVLWCAAAMAVSEHGWPGRADVLLFATGAAVAFLTLGAAGRSHLEREVPMRVPSTVVANVFPVVVALVLAALPLRALGKPAAYLTTSFVATAMYVGTLAAVVRASASREPDAAPRP